MKVSRGSWVAESVRCLSSAQIPHIGLPSCFSLFLSSPAPAHSLSLTPSLSLLQINKNKIFQKKKSILKNSIADDSGFSFYLIQGTVLKLALRVLSELGQHIWIRVQTLQRCHKILLRQKHHLNWHFGLTVKFPLKICVFWHPIIPYLFQENNLLLKIEYIDFLYLPLLGSIFN